MDEFSDDTDISVRKKANGGITILWNSKFSDRINQLSTGNDRIQCIILDTEPIKTCLINVYLPAQKDNRRLYEYREHLDMLHEILETTSNFRHMIIGDFNGSMIRANPHDKSLQKFVKDHNLSYCATDQMTYKGHNSSQSQIDYVFSDDPSLVEEFQILSEPVCVNTSTHHALSIKSRLLLTSTRSSLQQTRRVFKWDKADYIHLAIDFENLVPDSFKNDELSQDLEANAKAITRALTLAIENNVPSTIIRTGQKTRAVAPAIKAKLQDGKIAHYLWKKHLVIDDIRKKAKADSRRALRQAAAMEQVSFYESVMHNVNNKNFHRLINRQRASVLSEITTLVIDDITVCDPHEQALLLAKYYEKLATPKEDEHFNDDYRNQVIEDVKSIRKIVKTANSNHPISLEETNAAIRALNRGKAADEFYVRAEAIQECTSVTAPVLMKLFEQCRLQKSVPNHFKRGTLTSIAKKGKIQHDRKTIVALL